MFGGDLNPFVSVERLRSLLNEFPDKYREYYRAEMASRLAIDPTHEELSELVSSLKNYWSGSRMFYPELFAFLFDDSFSGLSVPSDGQAQLDQIRVRWSEMVDPSCVAEARQKAPVWMLSHWLLDQVIHERNKEMNRWFGQSVRRSIEDSTSPIRSASSWGDPSIRPPRIISAVVPRDFACR